MAYGEIKISGDDVLEALTFRDRDWNRVLTNEGETLADLFAERVVQKIRAKLALELSEDGQ